MDFYKPLPEGDPRCPAWQRFWVPDGASNFTQNALRKGWSPAPPANVDVYRENGVILSSAPMAAAPVAAPVAAEEPVAEKTVSHREETTHARK